MVDWKSWEWWHIFVDVFISEQLVGAVGVCCPLYHDLNVAAILDDDIVTIFQLFNKFFVSDDLKFKYFRT